MNGLRAANLALKFLIELSAIAAFAYWGSSTAGGVPAVLLAIAAPAAGIALWGTLAAPKAKRRLRTSFRVPFELTVFALAVAALLAATATATALVLGAAVLVNAASLTALRQWEA